MSHIRPALEARRPALLQRGRRARGRLYRYLSGRASSPGDRAELGVGRATIYRCSAAGEAPRRSDHRANEAVVVDARSALAERWPGCRTLDRFNQGRSADAHALRAFVEQERDASLRISA